MIKQIYIILWVMILLATCKGESLISNSSQKCFKTLFQFGASLFDTGNAPRAFVRQAFRPPYGSTFPGHPDNRYCDGKLIVDRLTDAFKVPPLKPFLEGVEQLLIKRGQGVMGDYRNGVCFSVALSTALSVPELLLNGVGSPDIVFNPLTSDEQYQWFQAFKQAATASPSNLRKIGLQLPNLNAFERALYLPGEFGGNDYRAALLTGLSSKQVQTMVSSVVGKIVHLIEKLYKLGAREFLVIGVPPQGCTPFYLTMLNGSKDKFGCLAEVNKIHELHESMLKMAIRDFGEKNPGSNLIFADYYGAFVSVLKNPANYGIEVTNVACCGGGGQYNYNPQAVCGANASARCSKPENHVFWDDFHTTDAFNHIIANKFLSGEFLDPPGIKLGCPS